MTTPEKCVTTSYIICFAVYWSISVPQGIHKTKNILLFCCIIKNDWFKDKHRKINLKKHCILYLECINPLYNDSVCVSGSMGNAL